MLGAGDSMAQRNHSWLTYSLWDRAGSARCLALTLGLMFSQGPQPAWQASSSPACPWLALFPGGTDPNFRLGGTLPPWNQGTATFLTVRIAVPLPYVDPVGVRDPPYPRQC